MNCTCENNGGPFDVTGDRAALAMFAWASPVVYISLASGFEACRTNDAVKTHA
jgi:hypothetical protein